MEGDVLLDVLQINEAADLSVGVAGDVDEDRVDRGFLLEPVQRGDREELLERPVVEQRLEDGEIAHVLVGEVLLQVVQLLGLVALLRAGLVDLLADLPEDGLGGGAIFDVEVAEVEKRNRLLLLLDRIVIAFEAAEPGLVLQQDLQVGHDLVLDLRLVLLAERFALVDALKHLDDEHGVLRDDGPPALGDDIGLGHARGPADLTNVEHHVARVFLQRVVHRRFEVRAGTVVIDAQPAPDVEVTHGESHLGKLAIEAGRLDDGVLDRDDVRHLRADVEMDQPESLGQLGRPELFDGEEDFCRVQAELGIIARGERPLALAAGQEFRPESDHGLHARLGGDADDLVEFRQLLDDHEDALAQLAAEQGEADVIVVLVPVADDEALVALVHRQRDHQLGLRAGLQPVVVVLAGGEDLLDHFAELVDLDGKDAAVGALVTLLLDGADEDLVKLEDAVAQQVLEPDDHGRLQAHAERFVHHIHNADAPAVGGRLDLDESLVVHAKMAGTPALEPKMFLGLRGGPGG